MERLTARWAWLAIGLILSACGSSNDNTDAIKADARTDGTTMDVPANPDGGGSDGTTDAPGPGSDAKLDGTTDGGGGGDAKLDGSDAPVGDGGGTGANAPMIGPNGGKFTSADGRVTLEVPPGALTSVVTFTITRTATPPAGALGPTYDIAPANVTFAQEHPARVSFKPASGDLGGQQLGVVRLASHGSGGSWTELTDPVVDAGAGTVRGSTLVVGTFGVLAGLCEVCDKPCDPAMPNCVFQGMTAADSGRCVAVGNGCSQCMAPCDGDHDGYCPPGAPGDYPGGDCDDSDPAVHPNAQEICGNGKDDDCNGHQNEGCRTCTQDADCPASLEACVGGVCVVCPGACDPANCRFGATEGPPPVPGVAGKCVNYGRSCSKCVPTCDVDGDGYCPAADPGMGQLGGDCDDSAATGVNVHPGAVEICGNNIDDNCDGHIDEGCNKCLVDADCPARQACEAGLCVSCNESCDTSSCPAPKKCAPRGNGCAACVPDCDSDGDGFCPGGGENGGDCNDADLKVHPGAVEICGNGKDDNCDGHIDEGCRTCTTSDNCNGLENCVGGVCVVCGTCNAADCRFGATDNPPAAGVAGMCFSFGKGCSVCVPTCDMDGDGFCPMADPGMGQPGGDCDDTSGSIHPGAAEICGNGKDDNCDGVVDEGCTTCQAAAGCGMNQSCSSVP